MEAHRPSRDRIGQLHGITSHLIPRRHAACLIRTTRQPRGQPQAMRTDATTTCPSVRNQCMLSIASPPKIHGQQSPRDGGFNQWTLQRRRGRGQFFFLPLPFPLISRNGVRHQTPDNLMENRFVSPVYFVWSVHVLILS